MRSLMIFLLVAVSSGVCQSVDKPSDGNRPSDAEETVREILARPHAAYSSWDEKALSKFGDAASVALTKILGERDPSESEARLCLVIIRASFWYPKGVLNERDRKPQTALFVLKRLEGLRLSRLAKKEIVETRESILNPPNGHSDDAPRYGETDPEKMRQANSKVTRRAFSDFQ
jgi:hypothetical protein